MDALRERIEAAKIVESLKKHTLGRKKMSPSQVTAGLGLLKKTLPDLAQIEHSGEVTNRLKLVPERDAKRVA